MASWQIVYISAQVITTLALARIAAQAMEINIHTRNDRDHERGRLLLWVFIAVVAVFLAKDAFWTFVIFGRGWLSISLDTFTLVILLAILQVAGVVWFSWLWDRVTR